MIKHEGPRSGQERDPTRIAEGVARAVGVALTSHLHTLKEENCTPLSVRITLDQDNVSNLILFLNEFLRPITIKGIYFSPFPLIHF